MKEIKFRAWDKEEKQMLDFSLKGMIDGSQELVIDFEGNIWKREKNKLFTPMNYKLILMQYTGLKDKNGKEIYEGDILQMTFRENIGTFNVPDDIIANNGYTGRDDIYYGQVLYKNEIACFGVDDKENGFMQIVSGEDILLEVIGNIYENAELLPPQPPK